MAEKKKGLKGFSNFRYFPITKDDGKDYTPGTAVLLVGARQCTVEDTRNDYKIPGDDGIYDQGSDYESTLLTVNINEMTLQDLAAMTGATYDSTPAELSESDLDQAPQLGLTFAALMLGGGYRLYRYYNAKLVGYKADLRAKLDTGNEVNQYQLTFLCIARKTLGASETKYMIRTTKDIDSATGLTWLETIPAVVGTGGSS